MTIFVRQLILREYSKELTQNTIKEWSPKAGYTLFDDEAIEIINGYLKWSG